jgi:diguanylate cyclase (GGDEF)-like protein
VTPSVEPDERWDRLVDFVVALASGRLATRLDPSPASDAVDAVIVGLNMLAEELDALYTDLEGRVAERTAQLEDTRRQLEHLALHDPLTGLANRSLLSDRLTLAMARVDRGTAVPAVLVLDLDGFKTVNDSYGHAVGDLLLVEISRRLRRVARRADTVARLGGDEFAVVVDGEPECVLDVARRVLAALQHPIKVAQHSCWVTASIGIRFAARGEPAEVLLRDADTAMYVAKAQGKGRYEVYEPAMHTTALTRVRMAEQLRHGLARDELVVQYQLIVDLATEAPTGVEAVVRWNHPEHGLIPPPISSRSPSAAGSSPRQRSTCGTLRWPSSRHGAPRSSTPPRSACTSTPRPWSCVHPTSPLELRSPHLAPGAAFTPLRPGGPCLRLTPRGRTRGRGPANHRDPDVDRGPADPAHP